MKLLQMITDALQGIIVQLGPHILSHVQSGHFLM